MIPAGIQYKILERSQEDLILDIKFEDDFEYFQGHFDNFKLLAALIQIKVSIDFANEYFQVQLNPTTIPKMKFSNPIKPNVKMKLSLTWDKSKSLVSFKYFNSQKVFSLGDMHL